MIKISRKGWIFIGVVLLLQIIFRVIFFQNHLFFNEEQARDYIAVREAWEEKSLIALGPIQAETGGVKLGPLYYYLLLPFLLAFNFHPAAGTIMVSFLWLATLFLVFAYLYVRGSPSMAVYMTIFLTLAENFFVYTSIPLNTAIIFFFEAIFLMSVFEWRRTHRIRFLFYMVTAMAFLLHAHLTALTILPLLLIVLLESRCYLNLKRLSILFIIPLSYLPVLVYDFQHNFKQTRLIWNFIFSNKLASVENTNSLYAAIKVWLVSSIISHNALQFYQLWWVDIFVVAVLVFIIIPLIIFARNQKFSLDAVKKVWQQHYENAILFIFTALVIIGGALAHSTKPRHYLLIFFVPSLYLSAVLAKNQHKKIFKAVMPALLFGFLLVNIYNFQKEFSLQNYYPVNQAREGFSNMYNEQNNLARNAVAYLATSPYRYKNRTNDRKGHVNLVMKYLIQYHGKGKIKLTPKNEKPNRILYISYHQEFKKKPRFVSKNFLVYELTRKEFENL